jgi:hypothetical protein
MLLGTLLRRLEDTTDAAASLEALGDLMLLTQVTSTAAQYGETPGEYAAAAARRFANAASGDDWLALTTALERSEDPARKALGVMVRWAIRQDAGGAAGDAHSHA